MARLIASGDRSGFDCGDPREMSGWMWRQLSHYILGLKYWVITHHADYFEGISPQVVSITPHHVMHTDEQAVIHDVHLFQKLRIPFELFRQECPFLWPQLQSFSSVDPVEVFERHLVLFFCSLFLRVESTNCAALEVVRFMDVLVGREKVVHYDEMNLSPSWQLHAMKAIEA